MKPTFTSFTSAALVVSPLSAGLEQAANTPTTASITATITAITFFEFFIVFPPKNFLMNGRVYIIRREPNNQCGIEN
jgi:hypothetical protein